MDWASRAASADRAGSAATSPTVLIVEDEILIRLFIADQLREQGYTVVEAVTGDEALSILQSGMPIHFVFSDVQMPGSLDGIELARIVGAEWPEVLVVLTSAHLLSSSAEQIDNFAGFFPKPYDPKEVGAHIGHLADARPSRFGSAKASAVA